MNLAPRTWTGAHATVIAGALLGALIYAGAGIPVRTSLADDTTTATTQAAALSTLEGPAPTGSLTTPADVLADLTQAFAPLSVTSIDIDDHAPGATHLTTTVTLAEPAPAALETAAGLAARAQHTVTSITGDARTTALTIVTALQQENH